MALLVQILKVEEGAMRASQPMKSFKICPKAPDKGNFYIRRIPDVEFNGDNIAA